MSRSQRPAPGRVKSAVARTVLALLLAYASLLVDSRSVGVFEDIMGCEDGCPVRSAGWPTPYFYDYPGMSVGNRVEVDPLSIFVGPDRFVLKGFIPTLLFWTLLVNFLAPRHLCLRWRERNRPS